MKSLLISTSQQEKLIQNETERRRTIRLLQTRQIEKERAAQLRQTISNEKKKQTYLLLNQLQNEWVQEKADLHDNLEYQFRENLMEMGKGHKEAADQPDYEQEWLKKTLDNDARAVDRGQQALEKLHTDMMQNENERNLHILHRKAALELEKIRAQHVAKLPVPEDPLRDLQTKPTTIVTVHDPYNFTTTRYHLEERLVTKEDDQEGDAAQDALVEQERIDTYVSDKQRLWNEQQEKARVRGDNALKREVLDNAYDNVLDELGKLERQDRDRRQKEIQNLPKSIFIPPWRREEEREDKQRHMETAFEQVYQENHRKQPIPIVLMNEDEEEDAASDRTLVAENEEELNIKNPQPEYRIATETPSVNTIPMADEMHEDEEATLADPTIMTLQTPLPEQQHLIKQQNIHRLMEKIERQRQAAQNRTNYQTAVVTPTIQTPKRLVVSPGYAESSTSTAETSVIQADIHEDQSSANTTTAEIEDRRAKLEFRKQALEEQIRLLSARANLLPQNAPTRPMISSSSDVSIESLLKNLRLTNNTTTSLPSSSASSIYAGKRQRDDHEQFAQAVQAIVTSDESQLQTSSSGIAIEDDERSHETMSDDMNKGRMLFDKYESHSSEDRDHSLEDLISRLVATQQSNHKQYQDDSSREGLPSNGEMLNPSMIIDDLVDDVLSSMSSLSVNTPVDQRSPSPEIAQLLLLNRTSDTSHEYHTNRNDDNRFLEEKRLIEQELELIRRERENLLHEHEKYRQHAASTSSVKQPIPSQPPPPPSLLRAKLNIVATNEAHELSTIQEVDTPVSSRNTSIFHHRSPLKSSFDLQQLERISSADSSSSSSSASVHNDILASQISSASHIQQQQQQQLVPTTGLERDDSGISLVDGPRSSATSRTTLAGGNGGGGGGGRSSSSGIQSLLPTRQPRVRTITNETTTNTSTSTNLPVVITTPRSNTESDDQSISSISKKWRDILANECLPQLPQIINTNKDNQPQLTHSLGFGSSNAEELLPSASSNNPNDIYSSSQHLPSQEQFLRSQYDNEQCDLVSLIKVHEYLTKQQQQQNPSSTMTTVEQINPSSSTPSIHHQSFSTLTSVTYRSSLAKQTGASGPPISTSSHHSFSSSEMALHALLPDKNEHHTSVISDIHHLTNSPNTFETSITSNSSSSSTSNKHHDTLSYLIEQNQRAMQRLISNHKDNPLGESTTFFSSASIRAPDYESGQLTTISSEKIQQKSTLIETGSLSTMDFPSAILHAEDQPLFETAQLDCQMIDSDDRGILDEPSLTLLSNSYRSLTTTTTTTGQIPASGIVQSTSQQKKKQCSSPLSTCDDKTSACSTPALSPIKNEPLFTVNTKERQETSTSLFLAMPAISRRSPLPLTSSINSSVQFSSQKQHKQSSDDDTSLLSFERHELSAGNATLMTTNDHDELKSLENYSPILTTTAGTRLPATTNADWSYFVTVSEGLSKELERPAPSTSSSSSSSTSSSSSSRSTSQRHVGGLEFFIDGEQQDNSTPQIVQLPSLQSALQARRADFLATSQKRVDEIKAKDYTTINTSHVPVSSRLKSQKATTTTVSESAASSMNHLETDSEERHRRVRQSKERSKRLYDQLAEVQEKKKFHETKQQAQAYRARMNAFQTALNKKKTNNKKQQ